MPESQQTTSGRSTTSTAFTIIMIIIILKVCRAVYWTLIRSADMLMNSRRNTRA